jgi:hypothetical protein
MPVCQMFLVQTGLVLKSKVLLHVNIVKYVSFNNEAVLYVWLNQQEFIIMIMPPFLKWFISRATFCLIKY